MRLKLNILFFFIALNFIPTSFGADKFLRVKGIVVEEVTKDVLSDYEVNVVEEKRKDSTVNHFSKSKFEVWLPANRRLRVYFIKDGYVVKHIYVDASAIPSIAYKKKQEIELVVQMTNKGQEKYDFSKPMIVAKYSARDNEFKVEKMFGKLIKSRISADYKPPFPAPVDTYKRAQPTVNNISLTEDYNKTEAKSGELSTIIQGILFADMNYCFFNETTNKANDFLAQLQMLNPDRWGNLKPFDSPEYGKIIMRTVNREQSIDTLFALGVYVETSRLIFENFTSDSKVLIHLKKLKRVLYQYSGITLTIKQTSFVDQLKLLVPIITKLEKQYTSSLKNKVNFEMISDELFIDLREKNRNIYLELLK